MAKVTPILLFIFSAALTMSAQQQDWIRYVSAEGRYEANLPNQPQLSSRDAENAGGSKIKQYMALAGSGVHAFVIGYYDYDTSQTFSLDKARDAMVSQLKATLVREDQISLGGAPGRQITLAVKIESNDYLDLTRTYDINRRVYVLQCIFPKTEQGKPAVQDCDKLFDSFKVSQ